MTQITESIARLLARGVATSAELQSDLRISQATVSRALAALGDSLVRLSQGRNVRYGLRRETSAIGSAWPVFEITEQGEPLLLGRLHALQRDQYWFAATRFSQSMLTEGLPYFLQDLRPQGFIGRMVPKRNPGLGLPERISDWTDEDVLTFLILRGEDEIGNLLLGDESLQRFLRQKLEAPRVISTVRRDADYPRLADAAVMGEMPGSSAGGEHPKFTCVIKTGKVEQHVLVKFSPRGKDSVSRRWFDLLVCEHVAAQTLIHAGLTSIRTNLIASQGQAFLEVVRFDRVGAFGRRGVVSLGAIDDALLGKRENWISSAQSLQRMGKISMADMDRVRKVSTFGKLIGNTDMHFGNISLFLSFDGLLVLAPIYDMLPMMYAPTAANAISHRALERPFPTADSLDIWRELTELAVHYWISVASHKLISPEFAARARDNSEIVRECANFS